MSRATHVVSSGKPVDAYIGVSMPKHYLRGVFHGELHLRTWIEGDTLRVDLIVRDQNGRVIAHDIWDYDAEKDLHVTATRRP